MPISFNIIGCCVCRDIFRLNPDKNFNVDKFVQFVSPLSIIDETKDENILSAEELGIFDWTNFCKRNFCFDINKGQVENFVFNNGLSDYLILDLCELRFKFAKLIFPNGKENFVTRTKYLNLFADNFSKFNNFTNCKLKDIELSDDELFNSLEKYINLIKKYYKEEQIILIENYPTQKLLDDEKNEIFKYYPNSIIKTKNLLEKCYKYIENKIPNINVILPPENSLGYAQHLWGKDTLHFVDEYYEYLYKSVKIITAKENNKIEKLNCLKKEYYDYFTLLEKQKRMEYYLHNIDKTSLLPNSKLECENNKILPNWKISLAPDASYDKETHTLSCGGNERTWAILNQELNKNEFLGKQLTFSVKYKTVNVSGTPPLLNIAFVGDKDGKREYLSTKQVSDNNIDIDKITFILPNDNSYTNFNLLIYLNHPNQKAIIYETKLEYGENSSLF